MKHQSSLLRGYARKILYSLYIFLFSFLLVSCNSSEGEGGGNTLVNLKQLFVDPVVDSVVAAGDSVVLATGDEGETEESDRSSDLVQNSSKFDLKNTNLADCDAFNKTNTRIISSDVSVDSSALNNAFSWTSNTDIPLYLLGEYSYLSSFTRSCQFDKVTKSVNSQELQNGKTVRLSDDGKSLATISTQSVGVINVQALQIKEFDTLSMDTTLDAETAKQQSIRFVRAFQTTGANDDRFKFTVEHELQVRPTRRFTLTNSEAGIEGPPDATADYYFQVGKTLYDQSDDIYLQQRFTVLMTDEKHLGNRQFVGVFSSYKYDKDCIYQQREGVTDYSAYDLTTDVEGKLHCVELNGDKTAVADLATHTMTYAVAIDSSVARIVDSTSDAGGSFGERSICTDPVPGNGKVPTDGLYRPQLCQKDYVHRSIYLNDGSSDASRKGTVQFQLNKAVTDLVRQMAWYGIEGQFPATVEKARDLFGARNEVSATSLRPGVLLDLVANRGKHSEQSNGPGAVSAKANTDSTITITWSSVSDREATYNIYYAQENFAGNTSFLANVADTYQNFKEGRFLQNQQSGRKIAGLDGEKDYYFVVTAVNAEGLESKPATNLIVSAQALIPPTNVQVKAESEDTVKVSWAGSSSSNNIPYRIKYYMDENDVVPVDVGQGSNSQSISNLSPGTYHFQVIAVVNGVEVGTNFTPFTILPAPAVVNAKASGDELTIKWCTVEGADGYSVRVGVGFDVDASVITTGDTTGGTTCNGNERKHTFTPSNSSLRERVAYNIEVAALYDDAKSVPDPNRTGSLRALSKSPGYDVTMLPKPDARGLRATSGTLTFQVAGAISDYVTNYRVYYGPDNAKEKFSATRTVQEVKDNSDDETDRQQIIDLTVDIVDGTKYYVSFEATNAHATSKRTEVGEAVPIGKVVLRYDLVRSNDSEIIADIIWNRVPGATGYGVELVYQYQVGEDSDMVELVDLPSDDGNILNEDKVFTRMTCAGECIKIKRKGDNKFELIARVRPIADDKTDAEQTERRITLDDIDSHLGYSIKDTDETADVTIDANGQQGVTVKAGNRKFTVTADFSEDYNVYYSTDSFLLNDITNDTHRSSATVLNPGDRTGDPIRLYQHDDTESNQATINGLENGVTYYVGVVQRGMNPWKYYGLQTVKPAVSDELKNCQRQYNILHGRDYSDDVESPVTTCYFFTANGDSNLDGSPWENAYDVTNIDEIDEPVAGKKHLYLLADSDYTLSTPVTLKNGVTISGGYTKGGKFVGNEERGTGFETSSQDTVFRNYGIDASSDGVTALLHRVHITGVTNASAVNISGDNATVTLDTVTIKDNTRTGNGAGIQVSSDSTTVNIIDSVLSNNDAIGFSGAAIYVKGDATVDIRNSELHSNTAAHGAAIYVEADATVDIRNSVLRDNSAFQGAAIYASHSNGESPTVVLESSSVYDNTADSTALQRGGGSIIYVDAADVYVVNSTIARNRSANTDFTGDIIRLSNTTADSTVLVAGSSLVQNTATNVISETGKSDATARTRLILLSSIVWNEDSSHEFAGFAGNKKGTDRVAHMRSVITRNVDSTADAFAGVNEDMLYDNPENQELAENGSVSTAPGFLTSAILVDSPARKKGLLLAIDLEASVEATVPHEEKKIFYYNYSKENGGWHRIYPRKNSDEDGEAPALAGERSGSTIRELNTDGRGFTRWVVDETDDVPDIGSFEYGLVAPVPAGQSTGSTGFNSATGSSSR